MPSWHKASPLVKAACRRAVEHCQKRGSDIAKLALQFAAGHPAFACCLAGTVSLAQIQQWAEWVQEPIDSVLVKEVEEVLGPALNVSYVEGRPENN